MEFGFTEEQEKLRKGFVEYHQAGKAKKKPRMMGFQAEGAAPIVRGHAIEKQWSPASQ